jgi:hypothetical protein
VVIVSKALEGKCDNFLPPPTPIPPGDSHVRKNTLVNVVFENMSLGGTLWQILERKNLREEGFIVVRVFRGFIQSMVSRSISTEMASGKAEHHGGRVWWRDTLLMVARKQKEWQERIGDKVPLSKACQSHLLLPCRPHLPTFHHFPLVCSHFECTSGLIH